jgi:hypothetical protein
LSGARKNGLTKNDGYITAYSLLHSEDGNLSYINRSQEPAFFNPSEPLRRLQERVLDRLRITLLARASGSFGKKRPCLSLIAADNINFHGALTAAGPNIQ